MAAARERHGCFTAWLFFIITVNAIGALTNLLAGNLITQAYPGAPAWAFPVLGFLGIVNIVCAGALFKWGTWGKWGKWGFWGYCVTTAVALIINLSIGLGIASSIVGLVGVAILFGVLHIGGDKKGWYQLG